MIRCHGIGMNRSGRAGVTLIDLMVGVVMLGVTTMTFLGLGLRVANMNQENELRVAGARIVASQYSNLIGVSGSRGMVDGNAAASLLMYLRDIRKELNSIGRADLPYSISLDSRGILRYEFFIPQYGGRELGLSEDPDDLVARQNPKARGVALIYLRESSVPAHFRDWDNLNSGGSTSGSGLAGFDMNGDGDYDDDFTALFTAAKPSFDTTVLRGLPMTLMVRYYHDAGILAGDLDPDGGFVIDNLNDPNRTGNAVVGVVRDYVINADVSLAGIFD